MSALPKFAAIGFYLSGIRSIPTQGLKALGITSYAGSPRDARRSSVKATLAGTVIHQAGTSWTERRSLRVRRLSDPPAFGYGVLRSLSQARRSGGRALGGDARRRRLDR